MAAGGVAAAVPLRRRARRADHRSGEARADRGARHPAGVARRVDLAAARARSCRRRASTRPGGAQYLYHADFRAQQEQAKFDKLIRFAERLPDLRVAMSEHMELEPYERERVCGGRGAADQPRAGSASGRSATRASRGRTGSRRCTKRHVAVRGKRIAFSFRGKHRVLVRTQIVDAELAEAVRELLALPGGRRLFRYVRRGRARTTSTGARLNDYVRAVPGRGLHREGLPHVGRDARRRGRARRARPCRDRDGGEARRRGGHAAGRRAARQHAGGRAQLVRQPGRHRAVPRRAHDRRLPAAAPARRRRARHRARRGGGGAAQPAALVANSRARAAA